jgi:hypothetical protein
MLGVTVANVMVVVLAVSIHYECLLRLSLLLPKLVSWSRFRIVLGVFGAMIAHALEVWCFAFAYYLIIRYTSWGTFQGHFDGSLLDCAYFSFTTFTTIGFGDITPVGDLKFLIGLEALTGLMLVTWTASFLFIEMQRFWRAGA